MFNLRVVLKFSNNGCTIPNKLLYLKHIGISEAYFMANVSIL